MKKKILLVMPLMAISLLTCNNGGGDTPEPPTPTEDVKFSVQESSVVLEDNKAKLHLDWTPSSDVIEFSDFTFTLKNQSSITSTVTPVEVTSRPLELTIAFSSTVNENDTGDLKFHYNDKTSKKEGEETIEGIAVKFPIYVDKPIRVLTVMYDGMKNECLYEYDEQYRVTKLTINNIYPSEKLASSTVEQYVYNDHGDVTHFIKSYDEDEVTNITSTYNYDDKGNITIQTNYGFDSFDVPINNRHTFTYDELNRLTLECIYIEEENIKAYPDEWFVYTYTKNKDYKDYETMEQYLLNREGPLKISKNEFNDRGLIIKSDETMLSSHYITENTYDSYDNLIKRTFVSEGNFEEDYVYEYYMPNKPSKIIKEVYYEGKLSSTNTTVYQYDSHDRVKRETYTVEDVSEGTHVDTTTYHYEFEIYPSILVDILEQNLIGFNQ